jgi:hypothetical protein
VEDYLNLLIKIFESRKWTDFFVKTERMFIYWLTT